MSCKVNFHVVNQLCRFQCMDLKNNQDTDLLARAKSEAILYIHDHIVYSNKI